MNENPVEQSLTFDQVTSCEAIAQTSLLLGNYAMKMSAVERVPRYRTGERENNAEHSYMLSLLAPALAAEAFPSLDCGLIAQFANVHDLVETITGDVATFNADAEMLANKAAREHEAQAILNTKLDPYTAGMLNRYEAQEEPEARFVRMVDKLLPVVVDIHGQGERVLYEDYGVKTPHDVVDAHEKLQERFYAMFPEFPDLLKAHRILSDQFEALFTLNYDMPTMRRFAPTVG